MSDSLEVLEKLLEVIFKKQTSGNPVWSWS